MDQKRLMIRELTESAWNILARFEAEQSEGRLTREQAQEAAIEQVRSLHYGQEGKDYFWINDMHPSMIVHPYRPDLEGQNLTDFVDRHGERLFVRMTDIVAKNGAGYVRYIWQWKDDPERVEPKLSYVKGFAPWGWIIGTGIYIDDVDAEVRSATRRLQSAALAILAIVSLLMFLLLRTSVQSERGRRRAALALRASEKKYRALVEAAGESIFMYTEGEQLFANASMLRLVGYTDEELAKLEVENIIRPTASELDRGRRHWRAVMSGEEAPTRYETELLCRDGAAVRVMLALSRVVVQGHEGFMAVATRLTQPRELDLDMAGTDDELAAANRRMATLASLMMSHDADAMQVSRMLSANADTAVNKAVAFAINELGPPPVSFEILLLGSLGRGEVSLLADQDHAIVFDDETDRREQTRAYFLDLGTRLARTLDRAGYRYCEGGIMASSPRCCQSLSEWRRTFSTWVHALTTEDLLQVEIFFDFRGASKASDLTAALRAHVFEEVRRSPRFLHLLARSSLEYTPPLGAFGGFVLEAKDAVHATFDVKGVLAQIVSFARLRTLQHGVLPTGTLERLAELGAQGHLHAETLRDTRAAFSLLMQLRLEHQARRILGKLEPDNQLEPETMDPDMRARIKGALAHIKILQTALDHEFKGAP